MHQVNAIYLIPELLSRARTRGSHQEGPRPARRVAMAARHIQSRRLGGG